MSLARFRLAIGLCSLCLFVLLLATWRPGRSVAAGVPAGGNAAEKGGKGSPQQMKQATRQGPAHAAPGLRERVESSGDAGQLSLVVRQKGGKQVTGELYVSFTRWARRTSSIMAPEQGCALPMGSVERRSHNGTAEIRVPSDHWTWLRATGAGLSAYLRVPPFAGKKKMEILLDNASRALHVFLLESDYVSPAAHRVENQTNTSWSSGLGTNHNVQSFLVRIE